MSVLEVRRLTRRHPGMERPAVRDVTLRVEEGEVLALVGESGSGKTTLLRLIAGLEAPTSGEIEIGGRPVCGDRTWVPPERRGVALVFQDYALFPHLDVAGNVGYGLRRLARRERADRLRETLELVGLDGLGGRYPHELSGGQQQRVALARALAPRPAALLLDEPFSNLDRMLKARVRDEVGELIRRTGTTAVFVVHDSEDALALGDRIAVLRDGAVWQIGTPRDVYTRPRDGHVARFFGETNLLPARCVEGGYETPVGHVAAPAATGPATVALRPEELELADDGAPATVVRVAFHGSHQQVVVRLDAGADLVVQWEAGTPVVPGAGVRVRARPGGGRLVRSAEPGPERESAGED